MLPALDLRTPLLHRWAVAVLNRSSVQETFLRDEVVALKSRAVASWRGTEYDENGKSLKVQRELLTIDMKL